MTRLLLMRVGLALVFLLQTGIAHADATRIIRDEEIEQTLKTFGKPVFDEAGLSPGAVRFILIDNNDLNAFVAGGQNIFMFTGLLLKTENPAEVVGVIAHETGHIAGGHLFRTQVAVKDLSLQAMLANILGVAAAIGTRNGSLGMAISSAGDTVAMRSILRHSRVQETAADQAGIGYLHRSGLPASGFLSFMKNLERQELLPETQQSEYVRTHPLAQDRVDFLEQEAAGEQNKSTPPAWDKLHRRMKAKLLGYLFPDRALQDKGNAIETRYAHAIAQYRKGKMDKSLALLEPLLEEEPNNPYFHELKGQILFETGKIDLSITPYSRAVALAPKSGLIRTAFAHALLESKNNVQERQKEAIRQLEQALRLEPKMTQPHRLLAIAYGKQGKEGLSHLHLAEESLMQGNAEFALREAALAQGALPKNSASGLRAQDILADAEKMKAKKKKKS